LSLLSLAGEPGIEAAATGDTGYQSGARRQLAREQARQGVRAAREARRALRRPVTTPTEGRAVAEWLGTVAASRTLAGGQGQDPAAAPPSGFAARLEARLEPALGSFGPVDPARSLVETIRDPARAMAAAQSLRLAGWSEAELTMLELGAEGLEPSAVEATAGAARLVRNLARALSGAEALAGDSPIGGLPPGSVTAGTGLTEGLAAVRGGILESLPGAASDRRPDLPSTRSVARAGGELARYFGGLGPERPFARGLAGPGLPAFGGLREALGELLALTRLQDAEANRQVPARPATKDLSARLLRLERELGTAGRGVAVTPGAAEGAQPGRPGQPGRTPDSLVGRVVRALEASTAGPAGARRLAGATRRVAGRAGPTAVDARGELVALGLDAGSRSVVTRAEERARLQEPVALGSVLAPEAMLAGVKGAGQRALSNVEEEQVLVAGFDHPRGEDARASSRLEGRGTAPGARGRDVEGGVSPAARLPTLVQRLLAQADPDGGRPGSLAAFPRWVAQMERSGALLRLDAAEFTMAWLGRVDGTRSGIDLGLGDTRADVARTFGRPEPPATTPARGLGPSSEIKESGLAGESPLGQADYVVPMADERRSEMRPSAPTDRSGVRRFARAAGARSGSSTAAGSPLGEARHIDWSFVRTGAAASTSHADLGSMAAAAASAPAAGTRVPLPLVAPAIKAVAQAALRKPSAEPVADAGPRREAQPEESRQGRGRDDTGGDEEFEKLARAIATRIRDRMEREKDRRGTWT
jgi:hypothetical protein